MMSEPQITLIFVMGCDFGGDLSDCWCWRNIVGDGI